jgi:hypothetical protein
MPLLWSSNSHKPARYYKDAGPSGPKKDPGPKAPKAGGQAPIVESDPIGLPTMRDD